MPDRRLLAEISAEAVRAARSGTPVAVATVISAPPGSGVAPGDKLLVRRGGESVGTLGGGPVESALIEDALEAMTAFPRVQTQSLYYGAEGDRVRRLEAKEADAFEIMVEVIESAATLLIVGGGHIGLSLATFGAHLGFSVAVVDDREMYANAERFPMADRTMAGDVGALIDGFPIGSNTFVVLVSRGHKVDELAMRQVVTRGAAYVGMIGSKRRVSTVLRHMAEEGVPLDVLERVYTPIGLDIGAESPEEIAISILAEIIMVRKGAKGGQMRDSRPSIRGPAPD